MIRVVVGNNTSRKIVYLDGEVTVNALCNVYRDYFKGGDAHINGVMESAELLSKRISEISFNSTVYVLFVRKCGNVYEQDVNGHWRVVGSSA